ncbi:MAG: DNA methyltransferase, partial [Longimicrobiaceae bacterium]
PLPQWGARRAVLNDLSPAATFIAANYSLPFDVAEFESQAKRLLKELWEEIGWLYETLHTDGTTQARINYTVWSEVFACPNCAGEIVFLEEALDPLTKRVRESFPCPHCAAELNKDALQRLMQTSIDPASGEPWQRIRMIPVLINYSIGKQTHEKEADDADLRTLERIGLLPLPSTVPTNPFPIKQMYHGSRLAPKGFTHLHHLYLPRPAQALGRLWQKAAAVEDVRMRNMLLFWVEQAVWGLSVLNRYSPSHFSQVNRQLTGVYYVASQHAECSPWYILGGKLARLVKTFSKSDMIVRSAHPGPIKGPAGPTAALPGGTAGLVRPEDARFSSRVVHRPGTPAGLENTTVTTGTAAALPIPDDSIDYIFTDPPFGENIYYADLNFLAESWHRVWTAAQPEAIVDKAKGKGLPEYQELMLRCFEEYYRVLKPGRWMTVVFHNSQSRVWNAIQEAMLAAGFVVASVRTLDKQQGSYRQVTSTAVKQDLVISAYRPNGGLEQRFRLEAGTEEGVWDFVRTHLRQLPRFISKDDQAEVIAERQAHYLYDSMVSFHVQRGVTVPLSGAEFRSGVEQRFAEREGMYFLPEEVAEYDRRRLSVRELRQLQLFVSDEASAIQWLRQELSNKPQTLQELTPKFMQEAQRTWAKHEKPLELIDLLEQNFLRYEGAGPIPPQIAAWLKASSVRRGIIAEERAAYGGSAECGVRSAESPTNDDPEALRTSHAALISAAKDRWYVPDPNRAGDLEKLRDRALLKEFEQYRESKQRRLKVFRLEAVRAGFRRAWQQRDYATIMEVAERIPESVLQEDPKLLMWYDGARMRSER